MRLRARLLGTRPLIGNFFLIILMASFYSEKHFQMGNIQSLVVFFKFDFVHKEALRMRLIFLINKRDKPLIINLIFKTWHQIKINRNLVSYLSCTAGTSQQVVSRSKSITNTVASQCTT